MRFPLILLASVVVIGAIIWGFVAMNQSTLLTLDGSILKVRTFALNAESTLVMADFRITNPTSMPFIVDKVEMFVDRPTGDPVTADIFSRADIDRVFAYQKLTGPKYNEPLIISNRIEPGQTIDRMAAGRIAGGIEGRRTIRLRIHEFSGQVAEIIEVPQQK